MCLEGGLAGSDISFRDKVSGMIEIEGYYGLPLIKLRFVFLSKIDAQHI